MLKLSCNFAGPSATKEVEYLCDIEELQELIADILDRVPLFDEVICQAIDQETGNVVLSLNYHFNED